MDDKDISMFKGYLHADMARAAQGATAYLENLRYDYLEGKAMISSSESIGERRLDEAGAGRARQTSNEPPANR